MPFRRRRVRTKRGWNLRYRARRVGSRARRIYKQILPSNQALQSRAPNTHGLIRGARRYQLDSCTSMTGTAVTVAGTPTGQMGSILIRPSLENISFVSPLPNQTAVLDLALKYQKYIVTGYKLDIQLYVNIASSGANGYWFAWILTTKSFQNDPAYIAMTAAEKWRFAMCHPYLQRKWIGVRADQPTSRSLSLYISRMQANMLDKFEDLGDSESSEQYSGWLEVDNTTDPPTVVDTHCRSMSDSSTVEGSTGWSRSNLEQFPWLFYIIPASITDTASAPEYNLRLKKYVLCYNPRDPTTMDYDYTLASPPPAE